MIRDDEVIEIGECMPGCSYCTNYTTCFTCIEGYFLNDYECERCHYNC